MKLYLGADHRGFPLKEQLKAWLKSLGHDVTDCGALSLDPLDDFPDFAFAVSEQVAKDPDSRGILVCGSGDGMAMAANKCQGIRAATGGSEEGIVHCRQHNDLNVLTISADYTPVEKVKRFIGLFLATPFLGEDKFRRRIAKIDARIPDIKA